MIARCYSEKHEHYKFYGGRGIKVCRRWRLSFSAFLSDMGVKPTPRHRLERVNNGKGYSPSNCVWATHRDQCNNRRSNSFLTIDGKRRTIAEWSRESGINANRIYARLAEGWSNKRAVFESYHLKGKRAVHAS